MDLLLAASRAPGDLAASQPQTIGNKNVFSLRKRSLPTGDMPLESGGRPNIWLAWTGTNEIPAYLELCLESVRKHNGDDFNIVVITPDNIGVYIDEIHPAYEYLSYAHRADYIRCKALHQHGGIYLDIDTLSFKSLSGWYKKPATTILLASMDPRGIRYLGWESLAPLEEAPISPSNGLDAWMNALTHD